MNIRCVFRQFSFLLAGLSALMAGGSGGALWHRWLGDEQETAAALALMIAAILGVAAGGLMWILTRRARTPLGRREALLLVALSWLVGAALVGLPFFIWAHLTHPSTTPHLDHPFASPINCYFEAMSGLTTTGSTILPKIDTVPQSLLLWRSMTQWLGGLGIIVLFVAVLPSLGVGGKKLFRYEAPGPSPEGVRPQIRETARVLWMIYLGLTAAEALLLRMAGMTWFESVCHSFTTLATGGFSTRDASIGGYHSLAIESVIILFMVLAGVNFGLYYQLLRRRVRSVLSNPELRVYLAVLAAGSIVVAAGLIEERILRTSGHELEPTVGAAIRHGIFQVVSMQTTTGYCTANFDLWDFFPKAVLVLLMFVGASAGSTGGGIKIIRLIVISKVMAAEVEREFRPNVVRPIKVGRVTIEPELRQSVVIYIPSIILIFMVGTAALMFFESAHGIDLTTAATAAAATLNNIGPGLARVGAIENFSWFSDPSKIVMCFLMALGRLEVIAILALFTPRFWRSD